MRVRITPEYPGYVISDDGQVQGPTGQWAGSKQDSQGYHRVSLWIKESQKRMLVRTHIMVCTAFHGPKPSPAHQVAHRNGINTDNHVSNLRWATQAENNEDTLRHGTHVSGFSNRKLSRGDVLSIRDEWSRGVYPTYVAAATAYGVSATHVRLVIKGLRGGSLDM